MKKIVAAVSIVVVLVGLVVGELSSPAPVGAVQTGAELSLQTATPQEGFDLAVRLSRLGVTTTQPDREVLFELREEYANDAQDLIAVSHVVAVHFQTIAAANAYWQ